jgi:hypothetical protein
MGTFANDLPGFVPKFIHPPTPVEGTSGFAALGRPVPFYRRSAGDEALKSMGFTDADKRFTMISEASGRIERDDPHGAMEGMFKHGLDATGCYRLLATLLAAEPPAAELKPESTYVDLMEV